MSDKCGCVRINKGLVAQIHQKNAFTSLSLSLSKKNRKITYSTTEKIDESGRGDSGLWPQCVNSDTFSTELRGHS